MSKLKGEHDSAVSKLAFERDALVAQLRASIAHLESQIAVAAEIHAINQVRACLGVRRQHGINYCEIL